MKNYPPAGCLRVLASVSATFASAQTQPAPAAAPAKPAQPISITLYGFVRNDLNYDSRQMNFCSRGAAGSVSEGYRHNWYGWWDAKKIAIEYTGTSPGWVFV